MSNPAPTQVRLSFTREFLKGSTFAGTTHDDSLSFVSKERAQDWLDGIAANSEAGRLDYKVISSNIAEL